MQKLLLATCIGCASEGRLPPAYFAETPEILTAGHVSLTGAGGLGLNMFGAGAGGAGRVRVGVGGSQELGVEAAGILLDGPGHTCVFWCEGNEDTRRDAISTSAMLSWKLGLGRRAVIASLGGSHLRWYAGQPDTDREFRGNAVAGTLGFVARRDGPIYYGLRAAFAVPLVPNALPVVAGSVALGGAWPVATGARFVAELGARMTGTLGGGYFLDDGPSVGALFGLTVDL